MLLTASFCTGCFCRGNGRTKEGRDRKTCQYRAQVDAGCMRVTFQEEERVRMDRESMRVSTSSPAGEGLGRERESNADWNGVRGRGGGSASTGCRVQNIEDIEEYAKGRRYS